MRRPIAVCVYLLAAGAAGAEQPLWEFGMGASAISLTHYNGSEERQNLAVPLPYFVYRGKMLRVDRNNAYGRLMERDRLKLGISVGGNIPADSDEGARRGMPDLDPVIEVGPSLTYALWNDPGRFRDLIAELPLRAAIETDLSDTDHIGWLANPRLKYSFRLDSARARASVTAGVRFGDNNYHDHFYGVETQFVTPVRRQYSSAGGFGGWNLTAGVSRRVGRRWFGAFIRYLNLSAAQFADSPLVETEHAVIGGFAMAWIFRESPRTVE